MRIEQRKETFHIFVYHQSTHLDTFLFSFFLALAAGVLTIILFITLIDIIFCIDLLLMQQFLL